MKKIIISTIKYGVVIGAGFLFSAQTSFAALVLTPATVSAVSDSSAIFVAKVSNAGRNNTTVWFEWGTTSNLENPIVGMRDIYNEGYFQWYLTDLKPGTTYYFRAVAMLDSEKVTSPIATFTTDGGVVPVVAAIVEVPTVTIKDIATTAQTDKTVTVSSPVTSKKTAVKETATAEVSKAVVAPGEVATAPSVSAANTASVLGIGDSVFPTTLTGWILLFIIILVTVILMHMIYESNEKRKKALEEQAKMKMIPAVA